MGLPDVRLVEPSVGFVPSIRALVHEFTERGENLVPFTLSYPNDDADALVSRLRNDAEGIGIPDGFVPSSTFWLVEGNDVVAVSSLRHRLTDRLRVEGGHIGYGVRPSARGRGLGTLVLAETLVHARDIGIGDVLVTCDRENVASAAVIRANGGELTSEEFVDSRDAVIQRYWIRAT